MHVENVISKLGLLRGLLLLSLFGMPGILQFDKTGVTKNFGLFNLQSFSRMVIYIIIGIIVILFIAGIEKFKFKIEFFKQINTPLSYYFLALFISIPVLSNAEFLLSGYFVMEWVIFFLLFYLYTKEKGAYTLPDMFQDIILLIWLKIISLFIILPFFPSLGLFVDRLHGVVRIGGYFIGPNVLATLAAMLASYYYFYFKGASIKKYGLFIFAVIILLGTNSRGALLSFFLAFSFSLIWSRKGLNHLVLLYFAAFILAFLFTYIDYFLRGMGITNILTLSERIPLWSKYFLEFGNSPIIGFGFIAGVKKLGMIIPKIHWVAPHAHNDFVQAIMSGGLVMVAMTIGIYVSLYQKCFNPRLSDDTRLLMKNWFIQLFGYAMLTPIINWKLFAISGIFWILFITLKNEIYHEDPVRP